MINDHEYHDNDGDDHDQCKLLPQELNLNVNDDGGEDDAEL